MQPNATFYTPHVSVQATSSLGCRWSHSPASSPAGLTQLQWHPEIRRNILAAWSCGWMLQAEDRWPVTLPAAASGGPSFDEPWWPSASAMLRLYCLRRGGCVLCEVSAVAWSFPCPALGVKSQKPHLHPGWERRTAFFLPASKLQQE